MASPTTKDIEQFFQHLAVLQEYARRAVVNGELLTAGEDADRARRMQRLLEIGNSFSWSEKDIVGVLYGDLFSSGLD